MDEIHLAKVYIVMATRNAGVFLRSQIVSIQNQTHSNWALWIRDDYSSDGTAERLNEWADDVRINLLSPRSYGEGAAHAFFDALQSIPKEADYFAFCDQDDVWIPSKLELSIKKIKGLEADHPGEPCLVHSDMRVVNESLKPIADSFFKYQGLSPTSRNSLKDLLVQNHVTGCTTLFNRPLLERVLQGGFPDSVCMHDWWIALVAAASGHIGTIDHALVWYRQHASNDTGAREHSFIKGIGVFFSNPINEILKMRNSLERTRIQAGFFLKLHGNYLSSADVSLLSRYSRLGYQAPFKRRFQMFSLRIYKSNFSKTIAMYLFT